MSSKKELRDGYVEASLVTMLAQQIRGNRISRNLTQGQLAEMAGLKASQISRLENPGKSLPNIKALTAIAAALDIALVVRLVPFSAYRVPSFDEENPSD